MIRCRVMGCGQLKIAFVPLRDSEPTKGSIHASLFHQFQFRILDITSYRCPFLYALASICIDANASRHSRPLLQVQAHIKMPVILASLVFAISLSLLPYTESHSDTEAAEMDRCRSLYLTRRRRSTESKLKEESR